MDNSETSAYDYFEAIIKILSVLCLIALNGVEIYKSHTRNKQFREKIQQKMNKNNDLSQILTSGFTTSLKSETL